jgi:hypothetical protein
MNNCNISLLNIYYWKHSNAGLIQVTGFSFAGIPGAVLHQGSPKSLTNSVKLLDG